MSNSNNLPEWQQIATDDFLTSVERAQLDRIMDRLLPENLAQQIPGAVQVGATTFVSRLLTKSDATYREISDWRKLYRDSLAALDSWSKAVHGKSLAELDNTAVDEMIRGLEQGTLANFAHTPEQQQRYFRTYLMHMRHGCFGDPRWGGNRDKMMWRAMGYLQAPETPRQLAIDKLPVLPL